MKSFFRQFLIAVILAFCFTSPVYSAVSLSLNAPHSLQGTVIEASVVVSTDTPLAGFNAEINFPTGISIESVQLGSLLVSSGNFNLTYLANGQSLRMIAHAGFDTFTGTGELLKLSLKLDAAQLGLQDLTFTTINPEPLINSRHAVSNADGSVSLAHGVANVSFLAYSQSSDFDLDGMPDAWEIQYGLDPLVDNSSDDSDGDGYTDLEEYTEGTDPNDKGSNPGVVFGDSFEGGAGP